ENECRRLNERFFYAHTHGMPYVQLKWAETADGFMATTESDGSHKPIAVSTPLTQVLMHRERAKCDAIIVGAGTVVSDNPSLSVRLWPSRLNPLRVVLDRHNLVSSDAAVMTDGGRTLVISDDCIEALLSDLYRRNITSVMVEGGGNVLSRFIASGCWNEARVERNVDMRVGSGLRAPHIEGLLTNVEKHFQNIIYSFTNR
ncbi:MAG: RibD family protein, partial [Muribaculaceae bacterium]